MRKMKWEEAALFVVPLAIVPLALLLTRLKPNPAPPAMPPVTEPRRIVASATAAPTPEPTQTQPPPTPRLTPDQSFIAASRDGRTLYTFGGLTGITGDIHGWDAHTRVYKRSFVGLGVIVRTSLRLSPDGSTMYYEAQRNVLSNRSISVLLDLGSGRQRQFTPQPGKDFFHVVLSRHSLANIVGGSIELRSLRDGRVTSQIRVGRVGGPGHRPESLCASPDGSLLAWVANHKSEPSTRDTTWSSTRSDALAVYSLNRKRLTFIRTLPSYNIYEVAISGDNTKLIAIANYSPNAPRFYAGSEDSKLLVFDLPGGRLRHRLSLGLEVRFGASLQPSPDGKWLALQGSDVHSRSALTDWVQIVNLSSGQSTVFPEGYTWAGTRFSADSRELFITTSEHRLQLAPDARWRRVPF